MATPNTPRSYALEQLGEALLAGALFGHVAARRDGTSKLARVLGAGLLFAALAPALTRRLLLAGAARRRIHLRTQIEIDRPVREVFAFCRDFENFPRVIQSLHRVVDYQDGRSRWEVVSPSGELVSWDAQVTKYVPNVVIAWRSVPGSIVDCNGLIRFAPNSKGGTRLAIQLDYDPQHTGLSDAIRALFDVSRTDQIQADLARANFYLTSRPRSIDLTEVASESDAAASSA
jgi:uncharacterized membrane protein